MAAKTTHSLQLIALILIALALIATVITIQYRQFLGVGATSAKCGQFAQKLANWCNSQADKTVTVNGQSYSTATSICSRFFGSSAATVCYNAHPNTTNKVKCPNGSTPAPGRPFTLGR